MSDHDDVPASPVEMPEALVRAEERLLAGLGDLLPDLSAAALATAWDRLDDLFDAPAAPRDRLESLRDFGQRVGEVLAARLDEAPAAGHPRWDAALDAVAGRLGSLIQSMAAFTGGGHGMLSAALRNPDAAGQQNMPQLVAATGTEHGA